MSNKSNVANEKNMKVLLEHFNEELKHITPDYFWDSLIDTIRNDSKLSSLITNIDADDFSKFFDNQKSRIVFDAETLFNSCQDVILEDVAEDLLDKFDEVFDKQIYGSEEMTKQETIFYLYKSLKMLNKKNETEKILDVIHKKYQNNFIYHDNETIVIEKLNNNFSNREIQIIINSLLSKYSLMPMKDLFDTDKIIKLLNSKK